MALNKASMPAIGKTMPPECPCAGPQHQNRLPHAATVTLQVGLRYERGDGEIMLDYPGGFSLITPENQRGFPGFGQKNVAGGRKWSKKCKVVSFEGGGREN